MRGNPTTKTAIPRRGMTLIELLVVIVLLTTLVTTAIPIISPGGEERKIREANRSINAYLQGAQARAIQTGRPYGVAFRRLSADTDKPEDNAVCAQLRYVEVPPAYSGIDGASMARVCTNGFNQLGLQVVRYGGTNNTQRDGLPPGYDIEPIPDSFLRPGDEVQTNGWVFEVLPYLEVTAIEDTLPLHRPGTPGAGYFDTTRASQSVRAASWIIPVKLKNEQATVIQGDDFTFRNQQTSTTSPQLNLTHDWRGGEIASPENIVPDDVQRIAPFSQSYYATTPAPFKIYRQPTLAGGEPLELPSGVAIDLQGSLFGDGTRVYRPELDYDGSEFRLQDEDFTVLFAPEGHVHRVYGLYQQERPGQAPVLVTPQPVSSSLALLIGRRELIPASPQDVNGTPTAEDYAEPIDPGSREFAELTEAEITEITDQYNWLNLQSQWVVIGAQSGSVTSIDNSAVYVAEANTDGKDGLTMAEQLSAALDNAPRRSVSGGR